MPELKQITKAGIPAALTKAERYRFLNDPADAESICLDVLAVDPENQQALIALLLSITDQFVDELTDAQARAREVLPRIADPYKRAYYAGVIAERRAKAQLHVVRHGAAELASASLHEAMHAYEQAEKQRPAGNDEAILRWNTCVRLLARYGHDHVAAEEYEPAIGE